MAEYLFARVGDVEADAAIAASLAAIAAQTAAENAQTAAEAAQTAAESAQAGAEAAQAAAEAAADNFDDVYLGSKAADPTLDNDGNPLVEGQLYWNSVSNQLMVYDGAAWSGYAAQDGITDIVQDTTPQLGGNLDPNGFGPTGTWRPNVSDAAALGTSTLMWSDLFLALGAVINFNNGDVTITHAADTLAFAGGAYTFAGLVSPAANDGSALGSGALSWADLFLATGAVINWANGDVLLTHAANTLTFSGATSGYLFANGLVGPSTNDGAALGAAATAWSDLFLASGAVIGFNNGDVTITHSANLLAFAAATSGYSFANGPVVPGTNNTEALGTTALMWADLFLGDGSVINWNNGDLTLTHAANLLTLAGGNLLVPSLEVENVDTTLSRFGAGVIGVEGVAIYATTPIQSKSADYGLVLADAHTMIMHAAADNNPRTFTIPANASVAFPVGTMIGFINEINTLSIAITSDSLVMQGSGLTGTRTLAANCFAVAEKVTSTKWIISGSGLS